MTANADDFTETPAWRVAAPRARRLTRALYGWAEPSVTVLICMGVATPFLLAAILAPALLTFEPTARMLSPIAEARAAASGAFNPAQSANPLLLITYVFGDWFADSPGRVHLMGKFFAATIVACLFALTAAARFPVIVAAALCAALVGSIVQPYAGATEISVAFLAILATALLAPPAENAVRRASLDGGVAAAALFALWSSAPILSFAGFAALSATPFLTPRVGLVRYLVCVIGFGAIAAVSEAMAPGLFMARVAAASAAAAGYAPGEALASAVTLDAMMLPVLGVIVAAAIFGGRAHARAAISGSAIVCAALFIGGGGHVSALLALAAAIAAFSPASPFYDGVFRDHDRASIAVALLAGAMSVFSAASISADAAGRLVLQNRIAETAPAQVRRTLGLVQPNGPSVARWIEEGRFSTREARTLFALTPEDQSAALLSAAEDAQAFLAQGVDVAILSAGDLACVLLETRACAPSGPAAVRAAGVVFAPRLDLDAETAAARGRSEALLYSEFRLADQTPLWDIWVRKTPESGERAPQATNAGLSNARSALP